MSNLPARPHRYDIAVLIDAENVQTSLLQPILKKVSEYGTLVIKRAYGDFSKMNLQPWKEVMESHAIQPIQQFQFTTGKNSSDIALVIDAMDILYENIVDCFCIVSSDGDFAGLATRLHQRGHFVIGIGRSTTPAAFQNACRKFICTETLEGVPIVEPAVVPTAVVKPVAVPVGGLFIKQVEASAPVPAPPPAPVPQLTDAETAKLSKKAFGLIKQAFIDAEVGEEWVRLADLGQKLKERDSNWNVHNYQAVSFTALLTRYSNMIELTQVNKVTFARWIGQPIK